MYINICVHINMVVGEEGEVGDVEENLLLCTYVHTYIHTRTSTVCITISCEI